MSKISRRDFINGTSVGIGVAAAMPLLDAKANTTEYYPPALTGLRGSHPGANTHAHNLAWQSSFDLGSVRSTHEIYDLVVVGAGLSGLASAYFYRQRFGPDSKILILDNHDDFGGHAKRNEHTIDGQRLISYGGSQTLVEPRSASAIMQTLFQDVGIDLKRFDTAFDQGFYKRHELGATTYFNAKHFGRDTLVRHPFCNYYNYLEGLPGAAISDEEAVAQTPLSDRGKQQLLSVLKGGLHTLKLEDNALERYVETTNYFAYLKQTLGVDDTQVLRMARHSGIDWSNAGAELLTIAEAKECGALGFAPVPVYDADNPYIHHFPDGNAGVTRALVRHLIPSVAPGNNAEALVDMRFDYRELDRPGQSSRVRLNSTVVNVRHQRGTQSRDSVAISYVHDDTLHGVSAKHVVMACYNMMIPHIVSDLPEAQADALRQQMKSPLIYTTVGLRNWRALKAQGLGLAMCPGNMHQTAFIDFPVSLGGYRYTQSPDEPCVIQMISCPYSDEVG